MSELNNIENKNKNSKNSNEDHIDKVFPLPKKNSLKNENLDIIFHPKKEKNSKNILYHLDYDPKLF